MSFGGKHTLPWKDFFGWICNVLLTQTHWWRKVLKAPSGKNSLWQPRVINCRKMSQSVLWWFVTFYQEPLNWEINVYPVRVLGRAVDLPIQMPNPSPTLDKNLASMGPGISSSIGVGVWRQAPEAFPGSNTTLDTFQSAINAPFLNGLFSSGFSRGKTAP